MAARNIVKDKMVADTCVAGLLLVLRAETINEALQIWQNLVMVHASKTVNDEAREFIKKISKKNDILVEDTAENITSFEDDTPDDEVASYGDRKTMRTKSPFYPLFSRAVSKVEQQNRDIRSVSNELYAPEFLAHVVKQFLSLYPLLSAAVLGGDGLMNNAHVELHWKALRAQMARIPKSQQWPTVLLGHRHHQTRKQAKEILLHSLIPGLKFGNKTPVKKNKHSSLMEELSGQNPEDNVFRPTSAKKRKSKGNINASYDGSKEKWGAKASKQSSSKDNYMKNKNLDHAFIASLVRHKTGTVRVTGIDDEAIILTKEEVNEISSRNYVSNSAVAAGLLLLDKRLNADREDLKVYSIAACRLILNGDMTAQKEGKFITILPRHMVLSDFDDQQAAMKRGALPTGVNGGHFTLVSNLFCEENECNVYETFTPYRNPQNLLNEDAKTLLKKLCNASKMTVKCINVNPQKENECGPLAFGLALQLCFHYHEGGLNTTFTDVRSHLLSCLRQNELIDFPHTSNTQIARVLFSINI